MRVYLDDDSADARLAQLLRRAGHDVQRPIDVGMVGEDDAVHLAHAIRQNRVCLSHNHHDFENLHALIQVAVGDTVRPRRLRSSRSGDGRPA